MDDEVAKTAQKQFGLISRDQALELGLSKSALNRRVKTQQLLRFLPGVYRMPGTVESPHQRIMGTTLSVGPGAIASHETAAYLWNLEGHPPRVVEALAPRTTARALEDVRLHLPRDHSTVAKVLRGPILTTHLARTLVDLAATTDARRLERDATPSPSMPMQSHERCQCV